MKLVSIVLAAGAGTRFGGGKMTAPFRGEPLIAHAIRAARSAPVERVIVVCPPELDTGRAEAGVPEVALIRLQSGSLSQSLKVGIAAAGEADGAFIFLGDMPLVPLGIAAQLPGLLEGRYAVLPRHDGKPGHPVLLSHRAFPDIAQLEGDEGAGKLLRQRKDVAFLDGAHEGVLLDVDRAEDIARLERLQGD